MTRIAILALAAAFVLPAAASSDDAWAEHEKKVAEACFTASGFKDAKAHTKLMIFDDSVGMDALVVEGEYPQEHMKGEHGMALCLYNKSTETAVTTEMAHN
ncbi:MAG: hypothetical protein QM698_00485 [Micropepsaceae bacterium]